MVAFVMIRYTSSSIPVNRGIYYASFSYDQMHRHVVPGYGKAFHHLQVVGKTDEEGVLCRRRQRTIIEAQSVAEAVSQKVEADSGDQKTADLVVSDYPHSLRRGFEKAERVGSEIVPGCYFRKSGTAAAGPVNRDGHAPALTEEFAKQVGGLHLFAKAYVGTDEPGALKLRQLPAAFPDTLTSAPALFRGEASAGVNKTATDLRLALDYRCLQYHARGTEYSAIPRERIRPREESLGDEEFQLHKECAGVSAIQGI
jgi:hypothetical protein